jgi:hypothetical protein
MNSRFRPPRIITRESEEMKDVRNLHDVAAAARFQQEANVVGCAAERTTPLAPLPATQPLAGQTLLRCGIVRLCLAFLKAGFAATCENCPRLESGVSCDLILLCFSDSFRVNTGRETAWSRKG